MGAATGIFAKYGHVIDEIKQMEPHYILRPKHTIRFLFLRMLLDLGICTMLSVGILWVPMVPVWLVCLFRQGLRIAYMQKCNMSPYKVTFFVLLALAAEFAAAHYIRALLWLIVSNLFNIG